MTAQGDSNRHGTDDGPAQALLVEYLDALESGTKPHAEAYASRLDSEAQRTEFRELLEQTERARAMFPVRVRTEALLAGRYRLLRELGSGGFGKVWLAIDEELDDRKVAVKVLNALAVSTEAQETLDRERAALARLQHPGIVAIRDVGQHEGNPYLVMDLVDGVPLDRLLERMRGSGTPPSSDSLQKALPECLPGRESLICEDYWRSVTRIVIAVLRALESAHGHGIVHRDIKPANVIVTGGGHPVLLDFGIAGLVDRQAGAVTSRLLGTLSYLAPEQLAEGRTGSAPQTDLYQVGLLLYELLTLQPAFAAGPDLASTMADIRRGALRAPRAVCRQLPRMLEDICFMALERDFRKRYQSAGECREDLEAFLRGLPSMHGATGRFDRGWRHLRRAVALHRTAVLTGLAGCVGVALTLALWAGTNFGFRAPGGMWRGPGAESYVVEIEAERPGQLFAMLWVKDRAGERTAILPLLADRQQAEGGHVVPAGVSQVQFQPPEDLTVPASQLLEPRLVLADDEEAEQLQAMWTRYVRWLDDNPGARAVPLDRARSFAEAMSNSSRSEALTAALAVDDLLGLGWMSAPLGPAPEQR